MTLLLEILAAVGLLVIIGVGILLIVKFVKPYDSASKKKKKEAKEKAKAQSAG